MYSSIILSFLKRFPIDFQDARSTSPSKYIFSIAISSVSLKPIPYLSTNLIPLYFGGLWDAVTIIPPS